RCCCCREAQNVWRQSDKRFGESSKFNIFVNSLVSACRSENNFQKIIRRRSELVQDEMMLVGWNCFSKSARRVSGGGAPEKCGDDARRSQKCYERRSVSRDD